MNQQSYSLGMIETLGFPGLVAASDAAAKAADVQVVTYQKAESGIVTVYIIGDVASVQAAVAVGKEEAKRVGQLRYAHVIARPDEGVFKMINNAFASTTKNKEAKETDEKRQTDQEEKTIKTLTDWASKTVSDLRKEAHSHPEFPLTDQEIRTAKKEELIKHLSELEQQKGGDKS